MNYKAKEFNVSIADINFHLFSLDEIELEFGYIPFLSTNEIADNIEVECIVGLPEADLSNYNLVFEAKNEQQRFYSIYKSENDLCFLIYDQSSIDEIQQIAYLNNDFNYWKIYSSSDNALKYPMGPIMMHYLTLYTDAVLMHASCAFDGKKGRMFSGFSGAGKSTISGIWAENGAQIINDDRLVIRKTDGEFIVYNTPMYYSDVSKKAPLNAIYLIKHAPANNSTKLNGALAVSKVMAFCIQNNFDKSFISKRLQFFSELCSHVAVFELGFVPDKSVISHILENE